MVPTETRYFDPKEYNKIIFTVGGRGSFFGNLKQMCDTTFETFSVVTFLKLLWFLSTDGGLKCSKCPKNTISLGFTIIIAVISALSKYEGFIRKTVSTLAHFNVTESVQGFGTPYCILRFEITLQMSSEVQDQWIFSSTREGPVCVYLQKIHFLMFLLIVYIFYFLINMKTTDFVMFRLIL